MNINDKVVNWGFHTDHLGQLRCDECEEDLPREPFQDWTIYKLADAIQMHIVEEHTEWVEVQPSDFLRAQ